MSILSILRSKFDWLGAHIHANLEYDLQQAGKVAEAVAENFFHTFRIIVQDVAKQVFTPATPADAAAVKGMTFEQKIIYAVEKIAKSTIGSIDVGKILSDPTVQLAVRTAASALVAGLLV